MSRIIQAVFGLLVLGVFSGCGTFEPGAGDSFSSREHGAAVFEGPVPRAHCGPGSRPETDIQGRVPIDDRESGRAYEPYTCNAELIGGYDEVAAQWQMAWFDHCAYYGTTQASAQGVQVLDVSDPANPQRTATLVTPAMQDPWESLKVNERRGLLGAVGPGLAGPLSFDLYDVTEDCAHPKLIQTLPVNLIGHEGNWAPDGRTYFGAGLAEVMAIDTTNPQTPKPIIAFPASTHGLDVSDDGSRLYLSPFLPDNGLDIYDISLLHDATLPYPGRVPAPPVLVGSVRWTDGAIAQHPIPLKYGDRPFILFVDEGGLGMARMIDISDETNPVVVSKMKLEIDMPDAADQRFEDSTSPAGSFEYNAHYCGVDNRQDPTIAGCSYFNSGARFFDIRDPYHPKEIAYYNPSGRVNTPPGGSVGDAAAGYASAQVRFIPERSEAWFTDQRHGFLVVRLTNGVWPFSN